MTTDNLFPEEPKPKKQPHKSKQARLLEYLRTGKPITEEIYNQEIGGKSVSAAIHNIRIRGGFEKGEHVLHQKMREHGGSIVPAYRLVREASVDIPQKEREIDVKSFALDPEFGVSAEEPEVGESDFADYISDEEPPVPKDTPTVSSIMVGVKGNGPELVIMFKGDDYKPLRHVLTPMEVHYLLTNLEAFRFRRRRE